MEQTTASEESTELTISEDASDKARIEGQRIYDAVDCNVTVQSSDFKNRNKIAVYWDDDEMNGYTKANVINTVMQSAASVELVTTRDGETAVQFVAN